MEMPVSCINCKEVVELNSTRISPLTKDLVCQDCYRTHDQVNDLFEEAKQISYDLENEEDYMKGDRRGWKKNLKELKLKIKELGFSYDDIFSHYS